MSFLFVFVFIGLAAAHPSGKNLACSGITSTDSPSRSNGTERPANTFCKNEHNVNAGGRTTEDHEFSFMSAIGWPTDDKRKTYIFDCNGALIHPNFILTSAHCVYINEVPPSVVLPGGQSWNGSIEQLHRIKDIITHPKYDADWPLYDDIALIKLEKPVVGGKIICLWSQHDLANDDLTIVSYGEKPYDTNSSPILLKAEQKIVTNTECTNYYKSNSLMEYTLIEKQLCSKDSVEKRFNCQGNFGGPLILKKCLNSVQIPYVVGVKSFGNGCDGEAPIVYSRVFEYLDWIEGILWPNDLNVKN